MTDPGTKDARSSRLSLRSFVPFPPHNGYQRISTAFAAEAFDKQAIWMEAYRSARGEGNIHTVKRSRTRDASDCRLQWGMLLEVRHAAFGACSWTAQAHLLVSKAVAQLQSSCGVLLTGKLKNWNPSNCSLVPVVSIKPTIVDGISS